MSKNKVDKFFVADEFRKNRLAEKDSPIIAEVHNPGHPIKSYRNIHYPNALAKKVFKESPGVTHIVFKNTMNGTENIIQNALHNGNK